MQLTCIPEKLSYSPVLISQASEPVTLVRRDLFDVRFQIIHNDGQVADAESDLIPGVYEGGLKTWECSLDLVVELDKLHTRVSSQDATWPSGRHTVELGCGTAIPSCYVLDQILRARQSSKGKSTLTLCDYNQEVLSLVRTFSPTYRSSFPTYC